MTEPEHIAYLNFCCGMLYATLLSVRGQISGEHWEPGEQIDHCNAVVRPLLEKVYQFQAQPNPNHEPIF